MNRAKITQSQHVFVFAVVLLLAVSGCRVPVEAPYQGVGDAARQDQQGAQAADASLDQPWQDPGSPIASGPIPNFSHWHSGYVLRICDQVLDPFETSDAAVGIHSHGDGLIHIHPFIESAGYEGALLSKFVENVGLVLEPGTLTLPGGGTWRDGDLCDDKPGTVFVDRWSNYEHTDDSDRLTRGFDQIRFEADGELFHIAFAPVDSPPVVPPSRALLPEVTGPAPEPKQPWIEIDPRADPGSLRIWRVGSVSAEPCGPEQVKEVISYGAASCFTPLEPILSADEVAASAVPVRLNREPAVQITLTDRFRKLLADEANAGLGGGESVMVAFELGGVVVTAPSIVLTPGAARTRITLFGGFTDETATRLTAAISG